MRSGTQELLKYLKRQKKAAVSREMLLDLAADARELGDNQFVTQALDVLRGPQPAKTVRSQTGTDPLRDRLVRYQKQSGLKMTDFIAAVDEKTSCDRSRIPTKRVLSSAPQYLSFMREFLNDDQIEKLFGEVLSEHF